MTSLCPSGSDHEADLGGFEGAEAVDEGCADVDFG